MKNVCILNLFCTKEAQDKGDYRLFYLEDEGAVKLFV